MLRITELKLPLDHSAADLKAEILRRLGLDDDAGLEFTVFRRAHDARKRDAIRFIYTIDVDVRNEAVRQRLKDDRHIAPRRTWLPFRGAGAARSGRRPVVIGTGPCGLFAGLILAQMGFRPDHPGARQGGARAHQGHVRPVAAAQARSRIQRAVRRGRRGHLFRRQALQPDQGPAALRAQGADEFVKAGAPPEILYVSKPHIGTFRLVAMVEKMRATIESLGGEIRFQSRVADMDHRARARCAACVLAERRAHRQPTTSCWRSATARATPSRCCTSAACTSRPSRFPSAFASSIRSR